MEMRRMVRQRLLAAAVIIFFLVLLFTYLASNGGSLSPSMASEVFFAKNLSYGSELHATDSLGDPGTANAGIKEDRLNLYNNQTEYCKPLSKGSKDDGGSAENPYFRSEDHSKTHDMVCPKTSPLVYDICVDSEGYEESQQDYAVDIKEYKQKLCGAVGDMDITVDRSRNMTVDNIMAVSLPVGWLFRSVATGILYLAVAVAVADGFLRSLTTCQFYAHGPPSLAPIQWLFLNPLTKELWLATVCFVFFCGFVFWMIERSINPEFQGSSLTQFSTSLYFVLSTLTFSQGQILRSPLSKIVLVVWCFVVLVLAQTYTANLSSILADEASANNGSSSASGTAPLTLRSFSGLFVVTGGIVAFMLLISLTRSAYAAYTSRVRGSESQSAPPQNDEENGSVVVHEQPVQEVRDNDSQGAHVSSAISRYEETGTMQEQDSMSNASEPAPDVYVQIEMNSTNGVGGAL